MIYINKDITTIERGIIAHGVNCQRVMGSGVAKALYTKWPDVRIEYMKLRKIDMYLGLTQYVPINDYLGVINCFTQVNYGRAAHKVYASKSGIRTSLAISGLTAKSSNLPIYMPKIGSGLGGLDWDTDVVPILKEIEFTHQIQFYICTLT